jgi:hypothetical protein
MARSMMNAVIDPVINFFRRGTYQLLTSFFFGILNLIACIEFIILYFLKILPGLLKTYVLKSLVFQAVLAFMVVVSTIFFLIKIILLKKQAHSAEASKNLKNITSNFFTSFVFMLIFPLLFFGFLSLISILFNLLGALISTESNGSIIEQI